MNLIQRLKNLWAISSYPIPSLQAEESENKRRIEVIRDMMLKSHRAKQAKIIETNEPVDEIPTAEQTRGGETPNSSGSRRYTGGDL